ncbi:glycosyltransferase [Kovacikia minuta CCNUW1]|uniref:glycosyltransferase family 2 protein n=1 Tax=Kovacikia minuta TaxID=2931930 RepID=UPI001CCFD4E7|nr:glycosyltransferase [Kovacikia minuta]UBF24885.1 glycosyltransferase [Kovacikia minuta CCNUW1]
MALISVIIPAYNSMTYLPETLNSVLGQTHADFEVLIIDDGSSDHVQEWASKIADSRVKLIAQPNQGASAARNTGITHAQGKYLAFLDADDLWQPNKLEKQLQCFAENPEVGLVHTWVTMINEKSKPTGGILTSFSEGAVWEQLLERNTIACCSVMVRRDCFEQAGLFDQSLRSAEDWDMWIRIARYYPFAVIRQPLALYRMIPTSKSKNCQLVEQSLSRIIEKNFQAVPPELSHLRSRSYGYANFNLAWKALQSRDKDYKAARQFRERAIGYYPELRSTRDYLRLTLAISLMQWFGPNGYSTLLSSLGILRRLALTITNPSLAK